MRGHARHCRSRRAFAPFCPIFFVVSLVNGGGVLAKSLLCAYARSKVSRDGDLRIRAVVRVFGRTKG